MKHCSFVVHHLTFWEKFLFHENTILLHHSLVVQVLSYSTAIPSLLVTPFCLFFTVYPQVCRDLCKHLWLRMHVPGRTRTASGQILGPPHVLLHCPSSLAGDQARAPTTHPSSLPTENILGRQLMKIAYFSTGVFVFSICKNLLVVHP